MKFKFQLTVTMRKHRFSLMALIVKKERIANVFDIVNCTICRTSYILLT